MLGTNMGATIIHFDGTVIVREIITVSTTIIKLRHNTVMNECIKSLSIL